MGTCGSKSDAKLDDITVAPNANVAEKANEKAAEKGAAEKAAAEKAAGEKAAAVKAAAVTATAEKAAAAVRVKPLGTPARAAMEKLPPHLRLGIAAGHARAVRGLFRE